MARAGEGDAVCLSRFLRPHRSLPACDRVGAGAGLRRDCLRFAGPWAVQWRAGEHQGFRRVSGHPARIVRRGVVHRPAATVALVRAKHGGRDRGRSCAQCRGEQPGPGPGDPVGAAGAATGVGLVASELLPAQAFRQSHCPALQREFRRPGLPAVPASRPVAAATPANGVGGSVGALDQARRSGTGQRAPAADCAGAGGHDRGLAAQP
ncbi:hypothetical protein D3C73_923240 [compost metagenome]